MKNISNQSYKF